MTRGEKETAKVLADPSVRYFCKKIITEGSEYDCCDAVSDVELALKVLTLRRDDALGVKWKERKLKVGVHLKCSVSTAISGHLTFGRGEVDEFGFWEIPCHECARDYENRYPETGKCWPLPNL